MLILGFVPYGSPHGALVIGPLTYHLLVHTIASQPVNGFLVQSTNPHNPLEPGLNIKSALMFGLGLRPIYIVSSLDQHLLMATGPSYGLNGPSS